MPRPFAGRGEPVGGKVKEADEQERGDPRLEEKDRAPSEGLRQRPAQGRPGEDAQEHDELPQAPGFAGIVRIVERDLAAQLGEGRDEHERSAGGLHAASHEQQRQ